MGAAVACVLAMIATSVAAAEPLAIADQPVTSAAKLGAKPIVKSPPHKRASRKKPAVVKPIVLIEPITAAPVLDPDAELLVQHRWPSATFGPQLSMSDQITDHLTELGNTLGQHLDLLSQDMFRLKIDGRRRRAHIGLGGGDGDADLLTFRLNGDIQFDSLNARVDAHLDLGIHGHMLHLELPAFQVQTDEYRGDYGVQVEVPVFEHRF
jgi:hypothetical protein